MENIENLHMSTYGMKRLMNNVTNILLEGEGGFMKCIISENDIFIIKKVIDLIII